jgi:transcriptional regulator with XRE-family HTH domain
MSTQVVDLSWIPYVGTVLHAMRTDAGLSQSDIVRRMNHPGFVRTHLRRVEKGTHTPTLEVLARIAAALDTTLDAVIVGAKRWAEIEADADHNAYRRDGIAV